MLHFLLSFIVIQLLLLGKNGLATALPEKAGHVLNEILNSRHYKADWIDFLSLDLQPQEHLLYASTTGGQSFTIANVTIYAADGEKIILMERFSEMLKSVDCGENMVLGFKSNTSFQYAIEAWKWVNEDTENSFTMVANYDACGNNRHSRQPYKISALHYDELNFVAHLHAKELSWKEAAHTFDLDFYSTLGQGIDLAKLSSIVARDVSVDHSWNLDLTRDFSRNLITKNINGLTLAVDCLDCSTKGAMIVALHATVSLGKIQDLTVSLSPQDFAATLDIQVSAGGSLGTPYSWQQRLGTFDVGGFTIEDIVTLKAKLNYDVGFSSSALDGVAAVSYGVIAKLNNSATAKIDLQDGKRSTFSGWAPTFEQIPVSVGAKVSADVSVYSQPGLVLEITVVGVGFEVGLDCKLPEIKAHIEALADSNGVCGTDKPLGVNFDSTIGVDLFLNADLTTDPSDSLFKDTIYTNTWPFIKKCFPFGPDNQGSCTTVDQTDLFNDPELLEYWNTESIGGDDNLSSRKRVPDVSGRTYELSCRPANLVRVQPYPGLSSPQPPEWLQPNNCGDCKDWSMVSTSRPANTKNWAAEHIYEGVWIRQFLDSISNDPNNPNRLGCDQVVKLFWGLKPNNPTKQAPNWMTEVMLSIGNNLRNDLMVFLVQDLNLRKFKVFNGENAIKSNRFDTATTQEKICLIAIIGRIMVYMNHPVVNPKLGKTAQSVEDTLARMAAEIQASADNGIKGLIPDKYDFRKVHRDWLRAYVNTGSRNAQKIISTLATNAMSSMASASIPPTNTDYQWFSTIAARATASAPAVTGI